MTAPINSDLSPEETAKLAELAQKVVALRRAFELASENYCADKNKETERTYRAALKASEQANRASVEARLAIGGGSRRTDKYRKAEAHFQAVWREARAIAPSA